MRNRNRFFHVGLVVLAGTLSLTHAGSKNADLGAPLRHCGIACLFGVLQVRGQTASTQEIEERIRQLFPDSNLQALNLQQLRKTSESYGIRCQSVHVPAGDILQIPLPAVLYLGPEMFRRNSSEPGYFVLLQSISAGSCRILDYTRPMPELIVPIAELTEVWGGKCLIFPQAAGPVTFVNLLVISALAVLVCFAAYKSICAKTIANRRSAVPAVVLLCLTTGCSSGSMSAPDSPEDASKAPPITKGDLPLSSVHEHIDLGVIESGRHANGRFTIRAWEKEAVTITGVEKSCSCIMTGEKLVGQTFAAGSEQELTISLPTAHSAGPIRGFVRLTTKPLASRPLELSVSAIVAGQPTLASGEILLTTPTNQESSAAVGAARFSLIRTGDAPPLKLVEFESNLDGLRLLKVATNTRPFEAHGVQVHDCEIDNVEVVLGADASAPTGKSRRQLRFAWNRGRPPTEAVATIQMDHPLRLRLDRLYMRGIKQGELRKVAIPLLVPPNVDSGTVTVMSSSTSHVRPEISAGNTQLLLDITGGLSGRSEYTIVLSHDSVPTSLEFPVTVIVE